MNNISPHAITPGALNHRVNLPTAQAALLPLCTIMPLPDCTFRMISGFYDLTENAGILNVKVSGAKVTAIGASVPVLVIGHIISGEICGCIDGMRVKFGPGDHYIIAPNWSWSLILNRCEQQILLIGFSKKFCTRLDRTTQRKFDAFFENLPWHILVKIAKCAHGNEFICNSLFGKCTHKSNFTFKVFLKVLKNIHQGNLLLKHVALDLDCSVAAVSQVTIVEGLSVSKWQRKIRCHIP